VRTELPFLLTAALLHVALLGAHLVLPAPSLVLSTRENEIRTIDIDSLEVPVAPPPPRDRAPELPSERAPTTEASPSRPEPRVARTPGSLEAVTEPVAPTAEPTARPSAPPGPAPDQYDTLPDDGRGTVRIPGIGGPAIWALPGMIPTGPPPSAAPTQAPQTRPVDKDIAGQVIREAMRTNDKQIGLDLPAAGTIASALRQAVWSGETPDVSRASFEVRLGADGKVLSIRVSNFTGGAADLWERAAQAAAAILRARSLRMNEAFAKGGTIYVDVVSGLQMPSGSSSVIRPQGAGASFDLSDIGAHKSRVVKVSHRAVPATR
jgi:hypothetical protein